MTVAQKLADDWRSRWQKECPDRSNSEGDCVIYWLQGENPERFEELDRKQLEIASVGMDYRWRILRDRYLAVSPAQGYNNLIRRLASLVLLRNKIRTWVALSRDRQRTVLDVLQEVIQELCERDRYMQQQIAWIGQCSEDKRLRNALLLATLEEYCLRPVRNQPLIALRFFNYLRRSQKGGLTQVPEAELIRLVSEEITGDESDGPVSLLDNQAIALSQDAEVWQEQQLLRSKVQKEFEKYLSDNIDPTAARWLQLYLQGFSQDAIAKSLNLPIRQIYRLREKVSYHAIRVFSLKTKPELVAAWLQTSLSEHSLGLTPKQWQQYWENLTSPQRQLLSELKDGRPIEAIAKDMNLKMSQVFSEWTKLYLAAQSLRNSS
ncbi:MAG: HetZ-related protein 2 [Oscillatoria sp. SIO1A7]|nr:HetZ-related protein 2 [Oscillatoria sp. SIO1A7]